MTDSTRRARSPAPSPRPRSDDASVSDDDANAARERFRHAAKRGDYRGLLDASVWQLFAEAAAQRGFQVEIGALRFALARLVAEETDPRHLATHLARVTTTILRAAEAHDRAQTDGDDPITAALTRALTDLSEPTDPFTAPVTRPRWPYRQEFSDDDQYEQDSDFDDPDADGDWTGDDL
jgi:hypothetical protein